MSANALREVFLLTPLREGRRKRPTQNPYPSRFLLTPLREGRLIDFRTTRSAVGKFLLTPLREGRRNFFTSPFPPSVFLLTPLREGRRAVHRDPVHRPAFLLTPLREGRPQARDRRAEIFNISTHAPAGGATKSPYRLSLRSAISTHAPAGGATASPHGCIAAAPHFYSRPCGRGDPCSAADTP